MIATGSELKATLDTLCLKISALAPELICSVLAVDREGYLHPLSAPSLPDTYGEAIDGLMIGPNVGSCGSAAFLRRPVIVTDIARDPRWSTFREAALSLGLRASWSTPLFSQANRVIGTFALYFHEARGPTEAEKSIVDACTNLCSIALERHQRVLERERRANIDHLTCLANRAAFSAALSHLSCGDAGQWALLIADLDNLKIVNDSFGHHVGDQLIQTAAMRMEAAAIPNRLFRIGGDEFAVLVQSDDGLSDLDGLAARILESLVEPVRRQNIWRNSRRRLAECGPRLGVDVRRRACGVASADARWSVA